MATEILHYHFGEASFRIQFDVAAPGESEGSAEPSKLFRVSLIRVKRIGYAGPLQYFSYSRDFASLAEARKVTSEHAKSLVRRQHLKTLKRRKT